MSQKAQQEFNAQRAKFKELYTTVDGMLVSWFGLLGVSQHVSLQHRRFSVAVSLLRLHSLTAGQLKEQLRHTERLVAENDKLSVWPVAQGTYVLYVANAPPYLISFAAYLYATRLALVSKS
jgi:hypothetical protein